MHFTQEPSNPSYFNKGSDVNLVWDHTDPHNNIQSIICSVLIHEVFIKIMVNDSQVSKNILKFLHLTKEELKLKEELPW